ncbi:MAG: DUF58 domain-containing protein [Flavobacteriaceae bacterium]|jgi:uncharacterized protein (DUF58 family)|nr:DUF58 domain-containing protein [Flavobacteriaceae bacterium]NVJ73168.1 DUF58 domain-containing protein [Flavobacteriaceae bacterium]
MDTKTLLKKVRKIEIKTRRLSDHIFGGEYHSTFKGRGMTFSEVRQYQFGDDVRAIDWNVTARYNEPYVKVFEEERELTMMLVVDVSASGQFGTLNSSKKEFITEISATLAFSAMQNNDKVGLLLFTDQIELFIPPKKGKSHILRIIRELLEFEPKHTATDINIPLEYLGNVLKKKAIVFLLSDFVSKDYMSALRVVAKKHDLTGVRIYDPRDEQLENIGLVPMIDLETKKTTYVATSSKKVRLEYDNYYKKIQGQFKDSFTKSGAGALDCSVRDSYVKKLMGYFKQRG